MRQNQICDIKNDVVSILRYFKFEFVDEVFFVDLDNCIDKYLSNLLHTGKIKDYGVFFHSFSFWGMIGGDLADPSNPRSRPVVIYHRHRHKFIYDILQNKFVEGNVEGELITTALHSIIDEKLNNFDFEIRPTPKTDAHIKVEIIVKLVSTDEPLRMLFELGA